MNGALGFFADLLVYVFLLPLAGLIVWGAILKLAIDGPSSKRSVPWAPHRRE